MKDCETTCLLVRLEKDVPKRKEKRRGEWVVVRPGETTVMHCKDYRICFAQMVYDRIDDGEYEFTQDPRGIEHPCRQAKRIQLRRAIRGLGR